MSIFGFLKTRQWVVVRRLILIGIVLFLGFRSYGDSIVGLFQRPDAQRDIVVTNYEFRPELSGTKPAWIIGLRNDSGRFTYDAIEFEATYFDAAGAVIETDTLIVHQTLVPGEETVIGSVDFRERPGAVAGSLALQTGQTN